MAQMKNSKTGRTPKIMEVPCQPPQRNVQRNEHMDHQIGNSNPKFEVGKPVMVRNHAHHTFEPKYLLDY